MADLTFASYLQGPLGEAIVATETFGLLPRPAFSPALTLTSTIAPETQVKGPPMGLLGPGHVAGLGPGTVVRADPPPGAGDVEPNYLAVVEVVPPELPWVLTPARAAGGRLRPWLVLAVLVEATAPVLPGAPLPTVDAPIAELPDLRDSWGWAHVQHVTGAGELPGGGQAAATAVARLICPRRLTGGVTYRACLVPAFASGVAAGLGDPNAPESAHDLAWKVDQAGSVRLPVYHHWTFTTGRQGDFETLVTRLEPADPDALRVSSVRLVDVRAPWPGDTALAPDAQRVGVQGALVPFDAPPPPDPPASAASLGELGRRLRLQIDSPAKRLEKGHDQTGALAPPLYGGRHVLQDLVEGDPAWLAELNVSVANRIAAGLGASYVRTNQEDLMARAWEQVGAIRDANRRRAVVELTTEVAERLHNEHVAALEPAEAVALAAPASARARTSPDTTLALETRMSRMTDAAASSAFARQLRPAGKLARRAGVTVRSVLPRALKGDLSPPGAAPVVPPAPAVADAGIGAIAADAAASQLVALAGLADVAAINDAQAGGEAVSARIDTLQLAADASAELRAGRVSRIAQAIAGDVTSVTDVTIKVLADMSAGDAAFGPVSPLGVPIADAALGARVVAALAPGDSHHLRLASQTLIPRALRPPGTADPVMAYPVFPVPTALALLASDPEWLMPGLGALPSNRVALVRQNSAFVASYLVGINHEMMRELLWREYPTDRRGMPFGRFWPRLDADADIPPIHTWQDPGPLGTHVRQADSLTALVVRGDVVRRYPGMLVTAVPSGPPDGAGHHRPDPAATPKTPMFVIAIDDATVAYAFDIPDAEVSAPATPAAPGWFFVFAEHGFRIRFGFDDPPDDGSAIDFRDWDQAAWPADDHADTAFVPVARGHALAGAPFGPPGAPPPGAPTWNRDAADIARIALQHPFRVAIQAEVLLHPRAAG
jgi:hypothetical protein